jgi:hypothetical protein
MPEAIAGHMFPTNGASPTITPYSAPDVYPKRRWPLAKTAPSLVILSRLLNSSARNVQDPRTPQQRQQSCPIQKRKLRKPLI